MQNSYPEGAESRRRDAIHQELVDVQNEVRQKLLFVAGVPYHQTKHDQMLDTSAAAQASCAAYAGLAAESLTERGYRAYVGVCSYHVFAVAVDELSGVHLVNADHQTLTRFNIEASDDDKPLFFDTATIAALQGGEPRIAGESFPRDLKAYDPDQARRLFVTAAEWTKYRRKPVGLLAWPDAHEFLIGYSIFREQLERLGETTDYEPVLLEAAGERYQHYAAGDIDTDRSQNGSFALPFLRAVKNQLANAPSQSISPLLKIEQFVQDVVPVSDDHNAPFGTRGQKIIKGDALVLLAQAAVEREANCQAGTFTRMAETLFLSAIERKITPNIKARLERVEKLKTTL